MILRQGSCNDEAVAATVSALPREFGGGNAAATKLRECRDTDAVGWQWSRQCGPFLFCDDDGAIIQLREYCVNHAAAGMWRGQYCWIDWGIITRQ